MRRPVLPLFLIGVALLLLAPAARAGDPQAKPFLRYPDIHGDRVAFACEGDLWIGDLTTGRAERLTRDEGVESTPRFSPDGTTLAYTASYDGATEIYTLPVSGGTPKRLTYRHTAARLLAWSPDGKEIIFGSPQYPASVTPFRVAAAGGYPQRLPLEFVAGFSYAPDGVRFAFNRFPRATAAWFGYQGGQKNDLWVGDAARLEFRKIYQTKSSNEYPVWAGDRICFVQDDGGRFSILSVEPNGRNARRLAGPYEVEVRNLQTDGKRLIYERGLGLEVCDLATGATRPVSFALASDQIHTLPYLAPAEKHVSFAHLGPTGKRVLVETRGQIVSVPVKEGDARVLLARPGVRYRFAALSPDARRLAYVSDETREQQLYVSDADGARPRQLTSDSGRQLKSLAWSPDSRWLAVTDSRTRLRLVDAGTGKESEIGVGAGWDGPRAAFSPDSRWLVYPDADPLTRFNTLVLYEIATGKRARLGPGLANDFAPVFSTDGKWLAFLSQRHFLPRRDSVLSQLDTDSTVKAYLLALRSDTPSPFLPEDDEETPAASAEKKGDAAPADSAKPTGSSTDGEEPAPVKIDLEGLYDRLIEIPVPPGRYDSLAVIGQRVLLLTDVMESAGGVATEKTRLISYDLKEKKSGTLAEALQWFQPSADGKKLLLYDGAASRVIDAGAQDAGPANGKLSFGGLRLRIEPRAEWEEMYWDAWRLIRDYFYVANMHGADWPAVGAKYAKLLPSVRSRGELNELIRWLLAELDVSHAWVSGGATRAERQPAPAPGFLGIDVQPDPSGFYRITRIFRGDGFSEGERSPLAVPGLNVKEGDYLIEVAGVPARAGEDFLQGLEGRAGQVVALKVNEKPAAEGARAIRVKPVGSEGRMRYVDWVRRNREYVAKASGGRVGYLHLAAMMEGDMADFMRQYFPQRNREALLVDDRFNGGGWVADLVTTVLRQRPITYFHGRSNVGSWTRQSGYFPGPMACLINEFSGSSGEEFPHYFRARGLGPLIGRRTWGGEVGSSPGWPLADGGVVAVPNYGAWEPGKGWVIEGTGVLPDQDVESDPNAYARGKDAQLDKAVELMLAALKRNPVVHPKVPADPVRVRPAPSP